MGFLFESGRSGQGGNGTRGYLRPWQLSAYSANLFRCLEIGSNATIRLTRRNVFRAAGETLFSSASRLAFRFKNNAQESLVNSSGKLSAKVLFMVPNVERSRSLVVVKCRPKIGIALINGEGRWNIDGEKHEPRI